MVECYVHEIELALLERNFTKAIDSLDWAKSAISRKIHRTLLLASIHPQTIFCPKNPQIVDKSMNLATLF